MSTRSDMTFSLDDLLANRGWLQALARSLVGDASTAADLEQETWRAALERPPLRRGSPRAWLATVVRNRARDEHRRSRRRLDREVRAAKPEALPPTVELAARADTQRRVIQAVLDLAEPYRSTVLWRYFEEIDTPQIAERMQIPASTVRTRLGRAHDKLRASLRTAHGGEDRAWRAALLPIAAGGPGGAPVSTAGAAAPALSGAKALALALFACAALVGVLVWQPWGDDEKAAPSEALSVGGASGADPEARPGLAGTGLSGAGEPERPSASAGAPAASTSPRPAGAAPTAGAEGADSTPTPPPRQRLVVRVLDGAERGVRAAEVVLLDTSLAKYPGPKTFLQRAKTDADGYVRFEDLLPKGNLQVRAAAAGLAAISPTYDGMELPKAPVRLVLEPTQTVAGRVADAGGQAVAGALVALYAELPGSMEVIAARGTDADGAFRMDGIPTSLLTGGEESKASLEVRAKAFVEAWMLLDPAGADLASIAIVLTQARVIEGRVVDASGAPLPGVSLEFPDANGGTETNADGRFRAGGLPPRTVTILFRSARHAPLRLEVPFGAELGATLDDVVLRPGKPIGGRVVDAEGKPLTDVHVAVDSEAVSQIVRQGGVGDDGRFRFEHLGEGLHKIIVFTHAGGEATHEGVRAGDTDVRVVMHTGPHLLLSFRDATGEEPVGVDAVSFHAQLAGDADTTVGAAHAGDGMESLRLQLPRQGRWDLTVRVTGYTPFERKGVEVSHDRGSEVVVRLVPLGR